MSTLEVSEGLGVDVFHFFHCIHFEGNAVDRTCVFWPFWSSSYSFASTAVSCRQGSQIRPDIAEPERRF